MNSLVNAFANALGAAGPGGPPPATVRPLAAGDVEAVVALEVQCNPQPWGVDAIKSYAQQKEKQGVAEKSSGQVPVACVAERDGRVVGYALAAVVGPEAEIMVLGVHPEARRLGVGRVLLRGLLGALHAAGARSVFLEVRHGNEAAIALYQSLGFGEAGVRKGYYADTGEDAVLMHGFAKATG